MFSGEFPKFKSQWNTWRNVFKKNFSRWKMESRHVHTHYMYLKPLNEGFIFPLISFSILLASIFWKVVWSYQSILPIKDNVHERRKQQKLKKPFNVLDDQDKIIIGFKVHCWKKSCLKIGKKIKDHTHHFCSYSCPVLQCITKGYLACSIAPTR